MAAIDQEWRTSPSRPMLLAVLSLVLAWTLMRTGHRRDGSGGASLARGAIAGELAEACSLPRWRRWKNVLWELYNKVNDDRILAVAGGLSFFGLLAIFPGTAAFVALYGLFWDWSTINGHLGSFTFMLPNGSAQIIADEVKRVAAQGNEALGIKFFVGLLIALWSANSGMKAMFDALNVAYGIQEKRSFLRLNLESLLFTFAGILGAMAAFLAVVAAPIVLHFVGLGKMEERVIAELRWPLLGMVMLLGLLVLYRFGPSRKQSKWRCVTWGSVLATLLWIGISVLFSWYVSSIGSYSRTYGALGAIVGFMTWIWLSAIVILLGAELNAEIERYAAQHSRMGSQRPGLTATDRNGLPDPASSCSTDRSAARES